MICCVTGACLLAIITVSFPTVFSVLCINVCLRGESKKIQETRDGNQYFICCSNAWLWDFFQQLSVRLTTYVHMNAALLGGFLMSPVWVSNLFTLQFRKARMSLTEFRPKLLIGKIFVYKHCFCFCFFHTPLVFHLGPLSVHTPPFPHPAFSRLLVPRSGTLTPRFPPSRNGHDFTGGFAYISREKKDFCYFIWYLWVN